MRRRLIRLSVLCLLLMAGATMALPMLLTEWYLHGNRHALGVDASALSRQLQAEVRSAEIRAEDGVLLRAWYLPALRSGASSMIVLHGVMDARTGSVELGRMLHRLGYGVLLPDARGHGESGGDLITFGLKESGDLQRWVAWLRARQTTPCVFALGESMGAALAVQAIDQFCAVVAESPFASFREAGEDRVAMVLGKGPWQAPLTVEGLLYAKLRYGVELARSSPAESVRRSRVPLLLIHPVHDRNVSFRHALAIQKARPQGTELWAVPQGGHTQTFGNYPEEFERRVSSFFAKAEKAQKTTTAAK